MMKYLQMLNGTYRADDLGKAKHRVPVLRRIRKRVGSLAYLGLPKHRSFCRNRRAGESLLLDVSHLAARR
jgi:hypothetical protein